MAGHAGADDSSKRLANPEYPRAEALELDSFGRRVIIVRFDNGGLDPGKLTVAERHVATLAIAGFTNAQIAGKRGTSVRTVEKQLSSIYHKLGIPGRGDLVARGFIGFEQSEPPR